MGIVDWMGQNWFVLLQSVGIIGSLLFTAASLRADTKAQQISNLLTVADHHRDIWGQLYSRPELSRVLDPHADLEGRSVGEHEELFINLLILHLSSAYQAMSEGLFLKPEGLRRDIDWFFALPIPDMVWRKSKAFQDEGFVAFVENSRSREKTEGNDRLDGLDELELI